MTFNSMVYDKRVATFHKCAECGHEFKEGETVWRRLGNDNNVREYLCQECYDSKFLDL